MPSSPRQIAFRPDPRTDKEDHILRALLLRYQAGDVSVYADLYERLAPHLRAFLAARWRPRIDIEDLVQETFLQIHRAIASYEPARPIRPWVFGIARLVLLMELRRRLRSAVELPLEVGHAVSTERSVVLRDLLAKAMPKVARDHRQAVLLHHVWGYGFQEVGRLLGITPGAARVRSHRGLRRLRDLLAPPTTATHAAAGGVSGQAEDSDPA